MRRLVSIALGVCVLLAGCGSGGSNDSTQATSASVTRPSIGTVAPPRIPTPTAPTNQNSRETPMGLICWTRREIALGLIRGLTAANTDARAQERQQLEATLSESAPAELAKGDLPGAIRAFAERLDSDVDRALALVRERGGGDDASLFADLSKLFDFEAYPSAKDYMATAASYPGCKEP